MKRWVSTIASGTRRKWFWLGGQAVDRPSGGSARIDRYKFVLRAVVLVAVYSLLTLAAMAQEPAGKAEEPKLTTPAIEELSSSAPAKVEVSPVAHDEEIVKRLLGIFHATNWFTDPQVRVAEGVVFLSGQVESEEIKKWAGKPSSLRNRHGKYNQCRTERISCRLLPIDEMRERVD